jgi:hypothetical protein
MITLGRFNDFGWISPLNPGCDTALRCRQIYLKKRKNSVNTFSGKDDIDRQSSFENLCAVGLWRHT